MTDKRVIHYTDPGTVIPAPAKPVRARKQPKRSWGAKHTIAQLARNWYAK